MRIPSVFFLVVAMLCAVPVAARDITPGAPLTLDQCFTLAEKRSETLQAQSERRYQAQQGVIAARGGLLPSLDFRVSKYYRDNNGGLVTGEGLDTRLEAVQPIFYGFRKTAAADSSKAAKLREDFRYASLARQLRASVSRVFYTAAQIESDARNVRDTIKLLQDRIKELDERVRLGKSRESEVLTVESQLAALRAEGEKLEGDRAKALETLSLLTGVASSSLAINDDRSPARAAEPLDQVLAAVRRRSDIKAVRQDVAVQESQVRIARGALLPAADLDASWYTARSGSLSGSDWDLYFLVDVPLFQGGILRSRLNEEKSRLNETRVTASLLERQVDTELRQLHHALVASLAQSTAYREAYNKAERSYRLQMKEYRLGLVNNLDVLQSLTTMLNVKSSFDRSLIQVKLDQVMLDIATERIKN